MDDDWGYPHLWKHPYVRSKHRIISTSPDLPIGAAHIRGHLGHHGQGMAQLRLSTAELSEDLLFGAWLQAGCICQ